MGEKSTFFMEVGSNAPVLLVGMFGPGNQSGKLKNLLFVKVTFEDILRLVK